MSKVLSSEGMAAQLYDEETIQAFHREAACLADQYSNYSIADSVVDGNLTLGENLADHGGLRMALAAYTQWRQDHVDYRWSTIYKNLPPSQLLTLPDCRLFRLTTCSSSSSATHCPGAPATQKSTQGARLRKSCQEENRQVVNVQFRWRTMNTLQKGSESWGLSPTARNSAEPSTVR